MKPIKDHSVPICLLCPHVQRHIDCMFSVLSCPVCGNPAVDMPRPVTRSRTREYRKKSFIDTIGVLIALFKRTVSRLDKFSVLNYIYTNIVQNFALIRDEFVFVAVAIKKLDEFEEQGWKQANYFRHSLHVKKVV